MSQEYSVAAADRQRAFSPSPTPTKRGMIELSTEDQEALEEMHDLSSPTLSAMTDDTGRRTLAAFRKHKIWTPIITLSVLAYYTS